MMARKDLLKNLMLQAVTPADGATPAPSDDRSQLAAGNVL